MTTSGSNRRLRKLLTEIRDGKLIPRPEFQRRLVWTNKDKESFIETVLLGLPFPEIYIAAGDVDTTTGEGTEMLVDGQQRMTTLMQYFLGLDDLRLKKLKPYLELSVEEKGQFLEYAVVIRDLGSKNIEEIKEIFQRINSTKYALNAMEIHNARFDGALKRFVDDFARMDFFDKNRVFSTQEIRRMSDVTFCLTVVISILAGYFNRDSLFEEFLTNYNDNFDQSEEFKNDLNTVLTFIDQMNFDNKSRIWRKADLLTLIVELYHFLIRKNRDISPEAVKEELVDFYNEVGKAAEQMTENKDAITYNKNTIQATNDKSSRVARGEIIAAILEFAYTLRG